MVYVFLCVLSGGVGVVCALTVSGGGCRLTSVCCQLCLQPPAHRASGHHGSHPAGPVVFYRYHTFWSTNTTDINHLLNYHGMLYNEDDEKLCQLCLDFPAVAGGEETEEARAAAELCATVSQHTGRYACFSSSYYLSGNNH